MSIDSLTTMRAKTARFSLKTLAIVLVVLAATGGAYAWWSGWFGARAAVPAADKADAPKLPAGTLEMSGEAQKTSGIAFAKPKMMPIVDQVSATGQMAFDERRVAHLRPLSQARVISVAVQPGEKVKKDQSLVIFDAVGLSDARAKLDSARAQLEQANATARTANLDVERGSILVRSGSLPTQQLDQRRSVAAQANATVDTAKAQVKLQQIQVQREDPMNNGGHNSAVKSPFDGTVLSVQAAPGDVVAGNGDIATVADTSLMIAQINLYENQLGLVHAGNEVKILTSAYPGKAFHGKVVSVGAQLDSMSNTAPARIEVNNDGGALKSGMFVSAEIFVDLGRRGIVVPSAAVQSVDGKPVAFVRTGPQKFERRDLQLGLVTAEQDEVRKGLSETDSVVTHGSFDLKAVLLKDLLGSTD